VSVRVLQVFKLFQDVNTLLKEKGPKTKKLTPLPDLDFTLGAYIPLHPLTSPYIPLRPRLHPRR